MTVVRWIILLVSIMVFRVWFPEGPPPLHVRFDYDLVMIALVGLARGPAWGTAAGWVIGFLSYAPNPSHLAWGTLFGALLGWVIGYWSQRLFLEHLRSRWIILSIGFFGYKLLFSAIVFAGDWGAWLISLLVHALPSALIDATGGVFLEQMWERARISRSRPIAGRPVYPEGAPWSGEGQDTP